MFPSWLSTNSGWGHPEPFQVRKWSSVPQGLLVVPSLVEGLEDVDELSLVEAVKAGHNRVERPDMVLLFLRLEGSAPDAETLGPSGETGVGGSEPAGESDDTVPERLRGSGRGPEGIQHVVIHVGFYKTSRIPVERNGG